MEYKITIFRLNDHNSLIISGGGVLSNNKFHSYLVNLIQLFHDFVFQSRRKSIYLPLLFEIIPLTPRNILKEE